MAKILAVDDEPDILALIKRALEKDGHLVTTAGSPDKINLKTLNYYNLILLDVMMPGTDGFAFCRKVRSLVDCPILFLTAKTMESDVMYGFGLGADDYIKKPFGIGELRARVNAHLRREKRVKRNVLQLSGLEFNLAAKEVTAKGQKIPLTKSEYGICEFLAKNHGQVFSKEQIYDAVCGYDAEGGSFTVAVHIKNIRAKLAVYRLAPISTAWGIGYKWD
ncbi:Response regulator SaeR [Caprobacter fermentans]|uniref:Stage 0 sporulation protein A homolog n=1 Tax=Caproicibacter fermentans TaxID=2576756 RepID=A0A6N8I2R4_9FIRM|nr:response regulator transcription factor [Caproicibacter fermentans]MVB12292.1 Response regulator SaeR [Caproicibacter fermentans]OCN02662.1 DNA-binding response regulator [Clostridium sp. W14A]QNK39780.1 response regulator transcription factor [Caproicibacter fermentans]